MTIGDWVCACGQRYRVLIEDEAVRMWPESAVSEFRDDPIDGRCVCGLSVDPARVASVLAGCVS